MQNHTEKYLSYLQEVKRYSKETLQSYRTDLEGFERYLADIKKTTSILGASREDVMSFLKISSRVSEVSSAYRNRRLSVLRNFFKYCAREGMTQNNPTEDVDWSKAKRNQPDFLTYNDYQKLITHIQSKKNTSEFYKVRDSVIIVVLYNTGIRLKELVALNKENIDFEQKEFRSLKRKGGKIVNLVVNEEVIKWLKTWLTYRKQNGIGDEEPALFLSDQKRRIHRRSVQAIIQKYTEACSFQKKVTPHTFRHSFCTEIQDQGASIRTAQELLDHSSIMTTLRYSHSSKETKRKAINTLVRKEKKSPKKSFTE